MALYKHVFQGKCAGGDIFTYQWHADSVRTLAAAHSAAVVWNDTLWNGATAGNGYQDHCSADVAMQEVVTTQINVADGISLAQARSGQAIAGVVASNSLPADVSMLVSLRTALPRRTGRGRFYLPQPAVDQLTTTGRWAADFINDVIASLNAGWAAYETVNDHLVIYSTTFRVVRDCVGYNIPDLAATQRRRENKLSPTRTSGALP